MSKSYYLSKSRYINGLQCVKLLWLSVSGKGAAEVSEPDEVTKHRFKIGNKVHEYARLCFPNGVLVTKENMQVFEAGEATKEIIRNAKVLFEPTFIHSRFLCRPDIMQIVPGEDNLWDLSEVKMSTRVKDIHIPDMAIQRYCLEAGGFHIRKTMLMHINTSYTRKGDIVTQQLFTSVDITDEVLERMETIEEEVGGFCEILDSKKCPDIKPGAQCHSPYLCPYFDLCNRPMKDYTIYELPRAGEVIAKLEEKKIKLIKDIPDNFSLSYRQKQTVTSARTGKGAINRERIKERLNKLVFPLFFFDFETINPGIPLWDNTSPYQFIPFQFSLHIQKKKGGPCEHHEFLPDNKDDPREDLIKKMLELLLDEKGSIIAYSTTFEKKPYQNPG